MFNNLQERLNEVFSSLTKRGALKENEVKEALREVRIALLEADVSLPVVKKFITEVSEKAVGQEILRSIAPGQMVVKIVNDQLVETIGKEIVPIYFPTSPPAIIMVVGLQGSGKTTTAAKLAHKVHTKDNKKVLLASLDVYRPAAQEQLEILGKQAGALNLPIIKDQLPIDIAKRATQTAKLQGVDVLILDTAGRLHVDEDLMTEISAIERTTLPCETLLVADSLSGQDAVNVAKAFKDRINVTGIVLTRVDGDARGGAALSMKAVTGSPIKLIGTGEKLDALEEFHPERIASRILGMGDIVGLVEKAKETIEQSEAEKLEKKFLKGQFDLDDLSSQLKQMRKMGGMKGLMSMMPGAAKARKQMEQANIDEKLLIRQEAIISSMTVRERKNVKLLNASRKRRVASGSGVEIQDVNRVLKQFKQMGVMMKKMRKLGKKGKSLTPDSLSKLMPPNNFIN